MPSRYLPAAVVVLLGALLYVLRLGAVGMLSVDEPRYASIGRAMWESGDWVTPRLWGEVWFEKPVLLYWLIATGWTAGLRDEWAARLPVALVSIGFLVFYYRVLARWFNPQAAHLSTLMLASTAGWFAFSRVAVTDLPLAAAFSSAMLLAMPWALEGKREGLTAAGVLLGAAILAKGPVALVLAIPALAWGWRQWRMLAKPALAVAAVAAPWYLLCYFVNGKPFFDEFFVRHNVLRFLTPDLKHVQPWWFYLWVLPAGILPWTPCLAALFSNDVWRDRRLCYLLTWFAFGLVFFSASQNKLPGYLLPLMPALFAIVGARWQGLPRWCLALSAAIWIALLPLATDVLPEALEAGLTRSVRLEASYTWLAVAALTGAICWIADWRRGRISGFTVASAPILAGLISFGMSSHSKIDERVSARNLWREIEASRDRVCIEDIGRAWRYGLNYYSKTPLPDCSADDRPLRLTATPGSRRPVLSPRPVQP